MRLTWTTQKYESKLYLQNREINHVVDRVNQLHYKDQSEPNCPVPSPLKINMRNAGFDTCKGRKRRSRVYLFSFLTTTMTYLQVVLKIRPLNNTA